MVGLVAAILPSMTVKSFGAAFWTAIIVSLMSWLGNAMFSPRQASRQD